MLTFVLVVILNVEPLVFGFLDGYRTEAGCEAGKAAAIQKLTGDDKNNLRCIKMILGDEPI